MTKAKLLLCSLLALVIGWIGILFADTYYVKSLVVHPDGIETVFNPTTNKKTQSYHIGDLRVYIDETYRLDMSRWAYYVKMNGLAYDNDFSAIGDSIGEELSMVAKGEDNNINPFILKLKIRNNSDIPYDLKDTDFKIHDLNDNYYLPHREWQEVMAKAGMFSGVGSQTTVEPYEEKVLWLVYSTPSNPENNGGKVEQEYVQMNYGSDTDWLATKVEFPFNFTMDYPFDDYKQITDAGYFKGTIALIVWTLIVGLLTFKIYKTIE